MPLPRANPFAYSAVLAEELEIAGGIWSSMLKSGFSPPEIVSLDVEFTSKSDESLENLATFLRERGYVLGSPKRRRLIPRNLNRHIEGRTNQLRVDEDLASTEFATNWADGYDGMGSVAMDLGLLNLALRKYDRAVELQPDEPSYRLNRGACRDYRKDYHGALQDYELVIAKRPTCSTALFNRGNTYHNMGRYGLACADWQRAADLGCEDARRSLDRHHPSN